MLRDFKNHALFTAFVIALFIFTALQAGAMPPHPGNLNPAGRERPPAPLEGDTPLYQSLMRSSAASRVSSSAPATGTVRVLVILADFGADVAAAPPAGFTDNSISRYSGKSGFLLLSALSAILIVFVINRWKWILPLGAYFFVLSSCPSSGVRIDYGDPLYFKTDKSVYNEILETGTETDLTMKQYYSDMSNGTLALTFDVVGPYRVTNGWQYYGANDSAGYDMYPGNFVGEAVDLAEQAGVDFSVYDNDGDNIMDTVIIIHAGPGEEFTGDEDSIWSHNWTLSDAEAYGDGSGTRVYDEVTINNYTLQPEYNFSPGDSTIGVFCHEFGHVLGLPDLYDTYGETNGVDNWSLMGSGSWGSEDGEDPAPLLAWERDWVGGSDWITVTDLVSDVTNQNIENIEHADREAFKIILGNSQYLLLEGKVQEISGNSWLVPSSGLLITHINENVITDTYLKSNTVNAGFSRVHGINIVEAANSYDKEGRSTLWTKSLYDNNYSNMTFSATTRNSLTISNDNPQLVSSHPNSNYNNVSITITDTSKINISNVTISNISSKNSFPMTFDLDVP